MPLQIVHVYHIIVHKFDPAIRDSLCQPLPSQSPIESPSAEIPIVEPVELPTECRVDSQPPPPLVRFDKKPVYRKLSGSTQRIYHQYRPVVDNDIPGRR